jgi:hypothetical protein
MSMGESHEHGRTTCAYEGVNGVNFRVIAQSSASGSSSKLFNFVSSPIVRNPVQSSLSNFWAESQRLSLSLAQWRSPIRMRNSYAHMTESMESILGFSVDFCFCFCFGSFFPLFVHQFSPYLDVVFLGFLLIYAIFSKSSS